MKKLLLASFLSLSTITAFADPLDATVKAQAITALGYQNQEVQLITNHWASVTNNTDQMRVITVWYKICADNKGCNDEHHYKVKVNPHATWSDGMQLRMGEVYHNRGRYNLTATTTVTGEFGLNKTINNVNYIEIN